MSQMTVSLENCRFYARHGVMEQERLSGNEFEISISVTYTPFGDNNDDLDSTVSYADLYTIAKEVMSRPRNLLETVARDIADRIEERWSWIDESTVKIRKVTPPIPGITGSASVSYTQPSQLLGITNLRR